MEIRIDGSTTRVRKIKLADTLVVELVVNPSGGYLWEVGNLPELKDSWECSTTFDNNHPKKNTYGGHAVQEIRLKPLQRGKSILYLKFKRAWEEDNPNEYRVIELEVE